MEYELVNVRRHPHPLLFEREAKSSDGACRRCRLPLSFTPSFRCSESDCDYQIHQSCVHLPPQINSSLHHHHPLSLISLGQYCQACGMPSLGEVYACIECHFEIDIKCAIANTKLSKTSNGKYVHISHQQHPLTLLLTTQEINKTVYCVVCELPIQSGSSAYCCSQCDDDDVSHFHKVCAELELQLEIPDHPHTLSLCKTMSNKLCHGCRNIAKCFMYSCLECKLFNFHIPCLQSLNHKHNFIRLQHRMDFTCGGCGENCENGFVFLCKICHFFVEEECREFSPTRRIYEHEEHDLSYFNYFSLNDVLCQNQIQCMICGEKMNMDYGGYGCSQCNYITHLKCGKGLAYDQKENNIENFNNIHPHALTVFAPKEIISSSGMKGEYRVCDGCMKYLSDSDSDSDSSYGCARCDFYIHEECAKLPTEIMSRVHPHFLTLISIPNFLFQCEACAQHFHGFAYHCKTCLSTFDTRCASIQTPFLHPNHPHPLFLVPGLKNLSSHDDDDASRACDACGEETIGRKLKVKCFETYCYGFNLDLRCATLPVILRYRFDQHPLKLTFFEKERTEEYYCHICEEEREPGVWFYSCEECSFEAHHKCVLGEFPFVKSAMHKSHNHPLNLVTVMEDRDSSSACGACNNKLYAYDFAFQCASCKFNVHATGPCYDFQRSEGKLVFTNYNAFSRANQPYHQSIPELPLITRVAIGICSGKVWKESVFSSITAFVIYHNDEGITCIQFQYPKNGGLVWSPKHGQEQGTRSEVYLDYPDEYLVSVRDKSSSNIPTSVRSLLLQTNRKTYGPYGKLSEECSSRLFMGDEAVGIIGSTDFTTGFLSSIGLLVFEKP